LRYRPDRARADFGQADGYIADKKVRLHYFCVYLPHAEDSFVNAFPAEPAEAFRDGHEAAFDFSGDTHLQVGCGSVEVSGGAMIGSLHDAPVHT
jgi:hypothetical protein